MHGLIYFFKLIRWPNLVMTIIALLAQWYFLVYKILLHHQLVPVLSIKSVFFLGLSFVLVMAAGYIMNDIADIEIDKINKEGKQIMGKQISVNKAWFYYVAINIVAAGLSISLAIKYQKTQLLILLPIAVIGLYLYSKLFKKTAFWGNLLIAVLCSLVIWMPYFAELEIIRMLSTELNSLIFFRFIFCSSIGGLLTFTRELVKDLEDIKGDSLLLAKTAPVQFGIPFTHKIIAGLMILNFILILGSIFFFYLSMLQTLVICLSMAAPGIIILFLILQREKPDYHLISMGLKSIMASGMLLLPWALSNV